MAKKLDYWRGEERAPFDRFNDQRCRVQMHQLQAIKFAVLIATIVGFTIAAVMLVLFDRVH